MLNIAGEVMQPSLLLDSIRKLEQEAMALLEVGNVILNACVGGVANSFGVETECCQLDFVQTQIREVFDELVEKMQCSVMILRMVFTIRVETLQGYFGLVLATNSVGRFLDLVDKFVCIGAVEGRK